MVKNGHNTLDYTIQITPTFIIEGEYKTQEVQPIMISSIGFGTNNFTKQKHGSSIISIPTNAILSEVIIKIVETNLEKIRAEKILEIWEENKDSIKTVINTFIPKAKEEEDNNASSKKKYLD